MPPQVEIQNICSPEKGEAKPDDLTVEGGNATLSDTQRLRFIRRDLRRLLADDPDHWFDFIVTLLDWKADIDSTITPLATKLEKIRLHIDAGRLVQLEESRLIAQVRKQDMELTSSQRLILAHYYLGGIGVAPDIDYAHELIRIAALAGNAEALLNIARMDIEGNPVPGWEAPLDMTVTLAFSGLLGQMNSSVCRRAERIAREYRNGDVVSSNAEVAYAWYKFAADLGGAEAAWRIVEFHLNADAVSKDNEVMLEYLRLAIERGITVEDEQVDRMISAGDVDEATLRAILGYNLSADTGEGRPTIAPFFQLAVNIDGDFADEDSVQLDYLRELSRFDTAPGWVYTVLAKETLVRKGRWAAEPEALELLEIATAKGDPEGMQLLAKKLVRQRDNLTQLHRSINLLTESVTRFGLMSSMNHLDNLYRCQANEAPMLPEAEHWATNYRATQDLTVHVSATDLLALDPFHEPLVLARLQSQALDGRIQSLANFVQRVQVDPWATQRALRLWAGRVNQSDKALEVFVELDFELATTPAERHLAIELFRRIYLNNGVTTSLDLAIALTEDSVRVPAIADEIIALLTKAGNRGEGASIRLKARLLAAEQDPVEVYEEFKDIIEERGDFLALMFAMPFIPADKLDDYIDRAVSLMSCGTKAVDEIGEAYAIHLNPEMSYHWRRIGLALEGGNALSKLRLSDLQMQAFRDGRSPGPKDIFSRLLAEGEESATRNLYLLTADPDLPTYNPEQASEFLLTVLESGKTGDESWVLRHYRQAVPAVRAIMARKINIDQIYRRAAQSGDAEAQLEYGLLLRQTATNSSDLQDSSRWLNEAAEAGNVIAMTELGYALAIGLGARSNPQIALTWLEKAGQAGDERAKELARLVRLGI